MRQKITDIVKYIIIINVIVHLCVYFLPSKEFIPNIELYFFKDGRFRPYQLVTHMFGHAPGLMHLGFNMMSLFFLGPITERTMGEKRFLSLYLLSGFGAVLFHMVVLYFSHLQTGQTHFVPVIGASGAIMGVVTAFSVMYPNQKLMLMFLPVPIKAIYLTSVFIIGSLLVGFLGLIPGIAHFAHAGGGITGGFLAWMWYQRRR